MNRIRSISVSVSFLLIALILIIFTVAFAVFFPAPTDPDAVPSGARVQRVIVIDAGHGGMDGGALAPDGTLEKDINLSIAKVFAALMRVSGYKVVMTRESDIMLGSELSGGSAKMRDLKARLTVANEHPHALTVSIHCNKFPMESCHGAQVYFGGADGSERAALAIQSALKKAYADNKRNIKKADSSIYLLHRATVPAVLVECGFLSNSADLAVLKDEREQKKLALCILMGASEFYEGEQVNEG